MSSTTFRGLRRADRGVSQDIADQILEKVETGYLGVNGDNGYPYVLPMSYAYDAPHKCIYFHSALEGHKIDAIKADDRVSFAVTDKAQVLPDVLSILFDSVVLFGRASIVTGPEKEYGVQKLVEKYVLGKGTITPEAVAEYVQKHIDLAAIIRLDIEHMTGKKRVE